MTRARPALDLVVWTTAYDRFLRDTWDAYNSGRRPVHHVFRGSPLNATIDDVRTWIMSDLNRHVTKETVRARMLELNLLQRP